jgi:hypothetical protein
VARVLTVLAHGDADGVGSAAVVKAALAGEYEAVRVNFTRPVDLVKDFEVFAEGMSTSSTWLSLHGAVAVVVNPRGRWGSPPTWRVG